MFDLNEFMSDGMKAIQPTDSVEVENVVVCIYGDPGAGKTSLSFTADKPLLFDFDGGVQRSVNRKLTLSFENVYQESESSTIPQLVKTGYEVCMEAIGKGMLESFKASGGKTIIIDTGGTLLDDMMSPYITHRNSKLKNATGGLNLQGFGALKSEFSNFIGILRRLKLDIVFICHAKEKDDKGVRPKMTGGSLDLLLEKSDLMGYLYMSGNDIILDFNPTDGHFGKNAGGFAPLKVPHFEREADKYVTFLADVIAKAKKRMSAMTSEQKAAIEATESFLADVAFAKSTSELILAIEKVAVSTVLGATGRAQINSEIRKKFAQLFLEECQDSLHDCDLANGIIPIISTLPEIIKLETWKAVAEAATANGLSYNKVEKCFEQPKIENADA